MIQVAVAGMILDQQSRAPVLLLHVPPIDKYLPIWIGPSEAASISMALKHERFERPLTHDLLVTIIDGLEGKVTRVVITDLRENTFFAKIFLQRDEQVIAIDARPSDSIAVAVRTGAPIFVAESIVEHEVDHLLTLDKDATRRALTESEGNDEAAEESDEGGTGQSPGGLDAPLDFDRLFRDSLSPPDDDRRDGGPAPSNPGHSPTGATGGPGAEQGDDLDDDPGHPGRSQDP